MAKQFLANIAIGTIAILLAEQPLLRFGSNPNGNLGQLCVQKNFLGVLQWAHVVYCVDFAEISLMNLSIVALDVLQRKS